MDDALQNLKLSVERLREQKKEVLNKITKKNDEISKLKKEKKRLNSELVEIEKVLLENENILIYCDYLEKQIKNRDNI